MDGKLCRVCATAADYKHCVALFSSLNLKNDLPGRMSRLLGVPVCQHDGRPSVICRRCMNNVTGLEKSLDALRKKAKVAYDTFDKENESRKRPKNTSGNVNVSPFTLSVRPPAKMRVDSRRRCLLPECKCM